MKFYEGNKMKVGIVLGSRSQWATMQHTAKLLARLGIPYEARIITVYKNSNQAQDYATKAINRGLDMIIAGSTGEVYLPEIIASKTDVPVLGIQINNSSKQKKPNDSKSDPKGSLIRMLNKGEEGAINAALFAANMLAKKYPRIRENLTNYKDQND